MAVINGNASKPVGCIHIQTRVQVCKEDLKKRVGAGREEGEGRAGRQMSSV